MAASGRIRVIPPTANRYAKARPFNEIEEITVLQEHFELAYAVPAKLFVLEVHGELAGHYLGKSKLTARIPRVPPIWKRLARLGLGNRSFGRDDWS